MPLFDNDMLLDLVTSRLVSTKVAPSLSRADAEIFWQTMCDDLWRQLCGKALSSTTVSAFKRKIGAAEPSHAIPRVRLGLGSFYFASQPHVDKMARSEGDENISEAELGNATYYSGGAGDAGLIGIAIYEDYLIRYGLKCRRQLAAKQLPDGTSPPTDINASRMYFEAANALTSLYGRTGGVSSFNSSQREGSRPPTSSSEMASKNNAKARPQTGQSNSLNASRIGQRPATGAGRPASRARCILDDLPSLRQELCRKFVQYVVEVIGEASKAGNDVEITIPRVGTLTIKQKVISLVLASTREEAGGDPAGGILFASRLKPSEREETLIENDGGENITQKQAKVHKPPLMSNKMRLRLQVRNSFVQLAADDKPPPISDVDSCFSSPSMNAKRAALDKQVEPEARDIPVNCDGSIGKNTPSKAVEAVRKLKITNKFDEKLPDNVSLTAAGAAASVRIGKAHRPSSSSGYPQGNNAATLAYLDSRLASLRGMLKDPLEELEHNLYGDYPPPPPAPLNTASPSSTRGFAKAHPLALPSVASHTNRTASNPFANKQPKVDVNKPNEINPQITKHRRLHSLAEQDVSSMSDIAVRRALKQQQQKAFGSALLSQARQRDEQRINEAAAAMVIQQKETEVQVLSEALEIIEKMKRKRELAREQGLGVSSIE